jgi:hypothetical protein
MESGTIHLRAGEIDAIYIIQAGVCARNIAKKINYFFEESKSETLRFRIKNLQRAPSPRHTHKMRVFQSGVWISPNPI